jgi:putative salt-induced outer membrane protein YdiY
MTEPDQAQGMRDRIAALEAELESQRAELARLLKAEGVHPDEMIVPISVVVEVPVASEVEGVAEPHAPEPHDESEVVTPEEEPEATSEPAHQLPSFLRGWNSSVEFGLNGSEGNTSRQALRFVFKTRRKTDQIETSFNSLLRMTSQDKSKSVRQLTLDGRNDWFNQDIKSLRYFAEGKVELDEAQPWDYRVSGFGGIGYDFIKTERTSLVGRSGFGGSQRVGIADDEFRAEAFLAANVTHKLSEKQNIKAAIEYLPDTSTWNDYRVNADAAWEVKIDPESQMYLRLGVANRFESDSGTAKPNDLDYFVNVGWSF